MDKLNCTSGQGKPLSKRHLLNIHSATTLAGRAPCAVQTMELNATFSQRSFLLGYLLGIFFEAVSKLPCKKWREMLACYVVILHLP